MWSGIVVVAARLLFSLVSLPRGSWTKRMLVRAFAALETRWQSGGAPVKRLLAYREDRCQP
jgi:hypothetical protein